MPHALLIERRRLGSGWVEHWTLNSPATRNALTAEMVNALRTACTRAHGDLALRGIVLQGAGGSFCAGGSLGSFASAIGKPWTPSDGQQAKPSTDTDADSDPLQLVNREFGTLLQALCALPQCLLVAVEGAAMGGGMGLVCCADFVLATHTAVFATPEVTLGIVPAQIAPFVVRRLGPSAAAQCLLFGQHWSAQEALQAGLVNTLVQGDLADAVQTQLQALAKAAPQALAATKHLLRAQYEQPLSLLLDQAAQSFTHALRGTEAGLGLKAFAARQPAPWSME